MAKERMRESMANIAAERLLDEAGRYINARRFGEAESVVASALAIEPRNVRGVSLKAFVAAHLGKFDVAVPLAERAIKLAPRAPGVLNNAASVFLVCGQTQRAIEVWRWLTTLAPDSVEAYYNMGVSYARLGDTDAAEPLFRKVIVLEARHAKAHMNLADIVKNSGRIEEAIGLLRKGIELDPSEKRLYSSLLYALHFDPAYSAEDILRETAAWGKMVEASVPARETHENERSPGRPLRIGYLSPNFRSHAVTYFILSLFRGTDRKQYETWAYSWNAKDDEVTGLLKEHVDTWRDVGGLDDAQLAQRIRDDKIDVLVDLTMHMEGGRLEVFARRPAPVQVTWCAYPSTTGLSRIDYAVFDPYLNPGTAAHYSEKAYNLPHCYWCYSVYGPRPDVSELPADSNGYVTFGCLNHYGKVTGEMLDVWADILMRVQGSRLLLHVGSKGAGAAAKERMAKKGVAPERVTCQMRVTREVYMKSYHGIDIGLDPYPYNGATTTCDAIWMGVPVVSRYGETAVARAGLSIMSNLGMQEFVVENWADYVGVAEKLAGDLPRLRELRKTLRGRIEGSKMMDAPVFAEGMTKAYREMWTLWCERGGEIVS